MNESSKFTVHWSEKKHYWVSLLFPLYFTLGFLEFFIPILVFVIFPLTSGKTLPIGQFMGLFVFFNITYLGLVFFPLRKRVNKRKPFFTTKFVISKKSIDIFLQNKLYESIFWKNVENIQILRFGKSGGFKLRFETTRRSEAVKFRLYLLVLKIKSQKKIVEKIKEIGVQKEIKLVQKEIGKIDDQEKRKKEYKGLKNFVKNPHFHIT